MNKSTIVEIIIVLFIVLFLYTGISKLMEYNIFREQIGASPILAPVSSIMALALPLFEFAITILLIVPKWRLKGLYASFVLMSIFTIYIIAILNFSPQVPCSCGGILAELSWPQHIIFNSLFIILSLIGISLQKQINKQLYNERIQLNNNNSIA